ncbi:MAG: Lrp/AsnC family transcriptional regulator [Candidatus Thorarchaeota archaeon]
MAWWFIVDVLDKAIILELSNSCRTSFSNLAKKYDVSVNTIKNRVEDLLEKKIIMGFDVQLKLSLLNASFALVILYLKDKASRGVVSELGRSPFIMATGTGVEPEGFAIAVYRNSTELSQAVEHLKSNDAIKEVEVFQILPPPSSMETVPSSKGLDALKKTDWKILYHLRWNGRMPLRELAKLVGKSVPTVRKRLEFMRKYDMIYETAILNIGAVGEGMVITFGVVIPGLTPAKQLDIEKSVIRSFEDNYWVSWMSVDKPLIFLTFQVANALEAGSIRDGLVEMFPESQIVAQSISGMWEYFRDFRDFILEEKAGQEPHY